MKLTLGETETIENPDENTLTEGIKAFLDKRYEDFKLGGDENHILASYNFDGTIVFEWLNDKKGQLRETNFHSDEHQLFTNYCLRYLRNLPDWDKDLIWLKVTSTRKWDAIDYIAITSAALAMGGIVYFLKFTGQSERETYPINYLYLMGLLFLPSLFNDYRQWEEQILRYKIGTVFVLLFEIILLIHFILHI